jgi:hypothetical protein
MALRQFVSRPLAAAVDFSSEADDTCRYVVRGYEAGGTVNAYVAASARVVSGNGATVRGELAYWEASGELAAVARTRTASAWTAAIQAQKGDRIVVEFGLRGITPSVDYDAVLRFGDDAETADFAASANLTTDLCPWFEFSMDLTFGSETPAGRIFVPDLQGGLDSNFTGGI